MTLSVRPRLAAGAAPIAIAIAMSGPAIAQSDQGAEQADSESVFALEEIVVTATRRAQSLQDVTASITAVGMEDLQTRQIHTIEDIQFAVPSITIGTDFRAAKLFIRGVGVNTSTTGVQGSVAVHVDGAVVGRPEAQTFSMFDLERVEVLRGPQGSLYGRNAVGGSINFITAKPTSEPEGYVRATIGKFKQIDTEGALSGPITDRLLARVAFKTQNRDGFGENPVTGSEIDNQDRRMARIHFDYLASDNFEARLSAEWFRQNDNSGSLKFIRETFPDIPALRSPVRGGFASAPRDLAGRFDPKTEMESWAITATLNWDVNEVLSLTSLTNFRDFSGSFTQDLGISAVVADLSTTGTGNTIQRRDLDSEQWTTELQANITTSWLDGVLGFFYFNEQQNPVNTVGMEPNFGREGNLAAFQNRLTFQGPPPPPGGGVLPNLTPEEAHATCNTLKFIDSLQGSVPEPKRVCINSDLESDAWAIFGQATVHLGELHNSLRDFRLKLGGRFTRETVESSNPANIILGLGAGPIMRFTAEQSAIEETFEEFTPEIGLEWQPMDNVLFYYTYSEGFKAGSPENNAGSRTILEPEIIESNEFGLKTSWLGGRVQANLSGFFFDLTNLQVNRTFPDPQVGFRIVFENAAEMSAHGVEFDLNAQITPRFRVNGAIAYLDSTFDEFLSANPIDPRNNPNYENFNPTQVDLSGNRTRNSPKWAGSLSAEYDLFVDSLPYDGGLTASAALSYRGETFFTEFNDPIQSEDNFALLDLSLLYTSGDGQFTAQFWAKNVTDQLRRSATFDLATAEVIGANFHPPRTFGFTVGYSF